MKRTWEEKMDDLRLLVDAQGRDGLWNKNEYLLGFYNGMEFALAIMEEREPKPRKLPKKAVK
jgi:hypothetical protein